MSLDRNSLITEVAKRWGIILKEDDPIIAVIALNDLVLEQHTLRLEAAYKALENHLEKVNKTYVDQSRAIAKIVVGDALVHATMEIRREADQAAKVVGHANSQQIEGISLGLKEREVLKQSATIAWTVAGISSLGLVGALFWFT